MYITQENTYVTIYIHRYIRCIYTLETSVIQNSFLYHLIPSIDHDLKF